MTPEPDEPKDAAVPWWHLVLWCMLGSLTWVVLLGLAALLIW